MRLRSRRRNLVVWSSSVSRTDRRGVPRFTPLVRTGQVRRWVRTGALLAIIGLVNLARTVRTRWRLTLSLAGVVLTVAGVMLPSGVIITAGLVVFLVALLIPSGSDTAFVYCIGGPAQLVANAMRGYGARDGHRPVR